MNFIIIDLKYKLFTKLKILRCDMTVAVKTYVFLDEQRCQMLEDFVKNSSVLSEFRICIWIGSKYRYIYF